MKNNAKSSIRVVNGIRHNILLVLLLLSCSPMDPMQNRVCVGIENDLDGIDLNNANVQMRDENGKEYFLELQDTTPFDGKPHRIWRFKSNWGIAYNRLTITFQLQTNSINTFEVAIDSFKLDAHDIATYSLWLSKVRPYSNPTIKIPLNQYTHTMNDTLFGDCDISSLGRR